MKKLFGLTALRTLGVVMIAWLFLEGVRLWYMDRLALEAFFRLGGFFLGPWVGVFTVGALGSAGKKFTDKLTGTGQGATSPAGPLG